MNSQTEKEEMNAKYPKLGWKEVLLFVSHSSQNALWIAQRPVEMELRCRQGLCVNLT